MKWKCTTPLLSVPVAIAAIGLGMNAIGQDRPTTAPSLDTSAKHPSPTAGPATADMNQLREHYRSNPVFGPMAAGAGNLLFDNGSADGENGISHFQGDIAGGLDRVVVDDFTIGDSVIDGARVCGVWFDAASCPGPFNGEFRIRIYEDAGGQPDAAAPIVDQTETGASCDATGGVFFDRPEVCYDVTASSAISLSAGTYWISIQPINTTDNFFHLTSATDPPANGEEIHLQGDFDPVIPPPNWQPGSVTFGAEHDVVFQLFGEGEDVEGACCLPKVDGEDQDPICVDGIFGSECAELDGSFNAGQVCDNVTCPSQVECPEVDDCPACLGDLNDDGFVNGQDLLVLLGCWGQVTTPACECADFNNDGVVNGSDFLVLLGNWGTCPAADGDGGDVIEEDEPCGERVNDGCNMDEPAFEQLACGDTFCGTAWTDVEFEELECPGDQGQEPGTCGPDGEHCGAQSPDGCWCDSECWDFGDCCLDICEECFGAQEINVRDTDWFNITVKDAKQRVTFEVHAEFPATATLVWVDEDCDLDESITVATNNGPAKVPFTIEACLQPDVEYKLVVVPTNFTGLPCEGEAQWGDAYTVSMDCEDDACLEQKGACCFGDICEFRDAVTCQIGGGIYLGDGTTCDGDPCVIPEGACCFDDGGCVVVNQDECINDLQGTYRGNDTDCTDEVLIDVGCNGNEQLVPICRDCGAGDQVWCNLQDVCDGDIDQDPFNGGCNYFDPDTNEFEAAFEQVCCGDLVGGEIWSIAGQGRDLDWRVLTLDEPTALTLQIDHGFGDVGLDAILFIAQAGCPATILDSGTVQSGGGLFTLLDPGTYYVVVTAEFAEGDNLECGTASSQYQLQINCAEQLTDSCQGNCENFFISHPGYPGGGFCSCDADTCIRPIGSTDLTNPDHCCPGICDFCEGDICEILCTYQYDTEIASGGVGVEDPTWTIMWMHRHQTPAGGDVINEIRTNYSFTHAGGLPVGWAIYEAAPDGSPGALLAFDDSLLTEADAVGNGFVSERQVFNTGGVAVDGEFFVAVFSIGSDFPAPQQGTDPPGVDTDNVWIVGNDADFAGSDLNDLASWAIPPAILNSFGIEGVWLMCANGEVE